MKEFLKEFPEVEVHLLMDDHELDLSQREADLAVRMRAPVQADLIQRKLFTVHYHIYAAKEFVKKQGMPKTLEDVSNFPVVVYGESAGPEIKEVNWLLEHYRKHFGPGAKGRIIRISLTSPASCWRWKEGLGIGVLPDYVAIGHPELVRVLPDVPAPSFDVHLVYADALRQSKRVAAFRVLLISRVRRFGSISPGF